MDLQSEMRWEFISVIITNLRRKLRSATVNIVGAIPGLNQCLLIRRESCVFICVATFGCLAARETRLPGSDVSSFFDLVKSRRK